MSTPVAPEPPRAAPSAPRLPRLPGAGRLSGIRERIEAVRPETRWTLALGAVLVAITLHAAGGFRLGPLTTVAMAVQVAAGLLVAAAILHHRGERLHGATSALAVVALAVVTALSILWAVNPSDAWVETNRTFSYLAAFAAGLALARVAPHRWGALVGATVLCATTVSAIALLSKVFPAENETFARLSEPFGYWNSVGLMGALGVPGALWLASRRHGHQALGALAYPALGILLLAMLLAYSRGSLAAAGIGAAVFLLCVPLRLRAVAALGIAGVLSGLVAIWAFAQDALTEDDVPLPVRETAGQQLGLAVIVLLALLTIAGLASLFFAARRPLRPQERRTAGTAVLVALSLVPFVVAGALLGSDRGLGGTISDSVTKLTDPDATLPANDPGRLTAVGSVRARYWDQGFQIFDEAPWKGVGAGGYATVRPRFRNDDLAVRHAHGYVPQTAADLGLLGLGASLAALLAWLLAARRTLGLRRGFTHEQFDAERVGLFTLASIAVVFGVHSFLDFTWFVPGLAMIALLCAGWVAGRGPLGSAPGVASLDVSSPSPPPFLRRVREGARDRRRLAAAIGVVLLALVTAWQTWQPQRSAAASRAALELLDEQRFDAAREKALAAVDRNPLSVEPLFDLGAVELAAGRKDAARDALQEAVRLQPSNAAPWIRLAEFHLTAVDDPRRALSLLGPALHLDPRSGRGTELFLLAQRRLAGAGAPAPGATPTPAAPTPAPDPTGPDQP